MKKLIAGLAIVACTFAAPAFAERTVMVMLQEMPMSGTPPAATSGVTVEVKMDAATMAAMGTHLQDGAMTLVCKPSGPDIMMCHGK